MKKIGYLFFSLVPLLCSFFLQFLAIVPVIGLLVLQHSVLGLMKHTPSTFSDIRDSLFSSLTTTASGDLISLVFASIGIVVYGFWYLYLRRNVRRQSLKKLLYPSLLLGIVLLVPFLQMLSSIISGVVASVFPAWMESYQKMMESVGFDSSPSLLLILYAVILGPIEEELTFRGVTMQLARRAVPFWAANVLQAVLFGIFHMNILQGIYVFFVGLFLGAVCYYGGSIWFSIFLHMCFNLWGTFSPQLVPNDNFSIVIEIPVTLACLAAGIFFIIRGARRKRKAGQ